MEERRLFKTLVHVEEKFKDNNYIKGRIAGFHEALMNQNGDESGCRGVHDDHEGTFEFKWIGTEEEYSKVKDLIVRFYGSIAEFVFDYKGNK